MQFNKNWARVLLISGAFILTACTTDEDSQLDESDQTVENVSENETSQEEEEDMHDGHGDMMHDESGALPEGLQEAENPTYPVGSEVIIEAAHMSGMNGAEATISGAFDTIVYEVSYDPTDGSDPVENHRWVIHEEIEGVQEDPLEPGTEVTLNARHMDGMEGATATINQAEETTIYMVDFLPTDGDEIIRNHQWVTEDELRSVE